MDRIFIKDMVFYGYHGVFSEEMNLGQKFRVQAELQLDLISAGRTDDLGKSVHYGEAFDVIRSVVEGEPQQLLEAVAEKIAEKLFEAFPLIEACVIQVEKLNPPIPGHTGTVAVEIKRKKLTNIAYLSIGTNMGSREQNLQDALAYLRENPAITVERVSSIYETDPVGHENQDQFLNIAVKLKTALTPEELLLACQRIEQLLGRKRVIRWGPRTIDLDILLYNEENVETENLLVPHPRMHERAFVLVPLAELDEQIMVPKVNKTVSQLLAELPDKEGVRAWARSK